jgi:hypothetical protein
MIGERSGPLYEALIHADNEIEKIAAELILAGIPSWDAIIKARKIYQQRQIIEKIKQTVKKKP